MLIGELITRSDLTKDAIRFYEKKGLIILNRNQRRENNYKEYSEQVLDRLLLIKAIKNLGFTLNEINDFLELWKAEDATCKNISYTLEDKIKAIDNELVRLAALRTRLTGSLEKCRSGECEFEKTVLSYVK